jgi:type IV secretion system protein TrbE
MFHLEKAFDGKAKSLSDALPWAALVEDGIVMTKSGGFLAAWSFTGPDMVSASDTELQYLAQQVNAVLNRRDRGWVLNVNAYRLESTEYPSNGAFPDRTSRVIDDERAQFYRLEGAHYETHYVLSLMYVTPSATQAKVEAFFLAGPGVTEENSAALRALATFKMGIDEVERAFRNFLNIKRLTRRTVLDERGREYEVCDLLSFLHFCLTGDDVMVRLPQTTSMYLDSMLGGQDMVVGWEPRIGDQHIRVVGFTGFPNETLPGILDSLNNLTIRYRFSTRAIFLDQAQAEAEINRFERNWGQKTVSLWAAFRGKLPGTAGVRTNSFAMEMQQSAQAALHEAQRGDVRFLFYTGNVVVMDEDPKRAQEGALEIVKTINEAGFAARIEAVNAARAFFGTLPGEVHANRRRPLLHSMNLAHLLPLTGVWSGPQRHPSHMYPKNSPPLLYGKTTGATPFRFSTHSPASGDVGHLGIFGPSGAGKSTLLALIVAQFLRYPEAQVFVFDKGYSMLALGKALEADGVANHYTITENEDLGLCPLSHIHESHAERAWAASLIETMAKVQDVPIDPNDRAQIARGVELLAGERVRALTNLRPKISVPKIKQVIEEYVKGPLGDLFNAERDGLNSRPVQIFELEEMMRLDKRFSVPVLQYLIHVIDRRVDKRPTLIVMDEAWTLLENDYMAGVIRSWLKVMRKKNAAVVFATQSLDDLTKFSNIGDVVLQECPTKIFLPNSEATKGAMKELYLRAGLTEFECDIITKLTRKQDYYYVSPSGRRPFALDLGPVALSFVGAGSGEDLARIRHLSRVDSVNWPATWLRERGLGAWSDHWLSLQSSTSRRGLRVA